MSLGGCFFMRAIVFINGQNLYHLAKEAWVDDRRSSDNQSSPYAWPSYDVELLARALVSQTSGRTLEEIRFYTGVPNSRTSFFWHGFWSNKIRYLKSRGIHVYRGRVQEKGVDVSLALDLVRAAYDQRYEVAIIVSQDSDFGPAVRLAKEIAQEQDRMLHFESCYPVGPGSGSNREIRGTKWVQIDQATYDACHDPRDYRPKKQ